MTDSSTNMDHNAALKEALDKIEELQARLEAAERARKEPLAVIGIGCRFPGGVTGPESYWQFLQNGVDAITEVAPDRRDIDIDAPDKTHTHWGGFLQDIDKFDPHFFGISPREAASMDLQHRLVLEVTWEALENAGVAPDKLRGSEAGVFIGVTTNEYLQLQMRHLDTTRFDTQQLFNNAGNVISGRVAFILGLRGPAISVDTACSSSLTAVHLACQSLRLNECDMALAGGANVILLPEARIGFPKRGHDDRCRTFDAGAAGFVRAEGCGVVVLKRLSDAMANGDKILAIIRGSAANHDGSSSDDSSPNGLAQQQVIRKALENAGVRPGQVGYVETHGAGTTRDDSIEVEALDAVYGEGRAKENPLRLGAVKTNLGHAESASGIAGLIKTVLALHHQEIPPNLHFKTPSPHIAWEKLSIVVPAQRTPWPKGNEPRFAGVSGFGIGGTNVHVILEETPSFDEDEREKGRKGEREKNPTSSPFSPFTLSSSQTVERSSHVLTLSAKDEKTLKGLAGRYADHLAAHPLLSLPEVCCTANGGRAIFNHRLAVVATSTEQARERLAGFVAGKEPSGWVAGEINNSQRPKVAFLYAGHGDQYAGMGRVLFGTQPTFRRALEKCDELFRPHLNTSLLSVLYPDHGDGDASRGANQTSCDQPARFSLQYALTELWLSWGIKPNTVMGHSLGEFIAAHVAGICSLEDTVKLVAACGRINQDVPSVGMMATLQASAEQVSKALEPYGGKIGIASINGPCSTVISGNKKRVTKLLEKFESEGVKTQPWAASNAFHSRFIEPMLDGFTRVASEVKFHPPTLQLISTLTGKLMPMDEAPDANYWRRHLREPVQFYAAMQTLHELGCETFLEIGLHSTQIGMGRECLPNGYGGWFPSLHKDRDDWQQILESLGGLFVRGVEIDWKGFERDYTRHRVWLPTYPFQRQRYWIENRKAKSEGQSARPAGIHPMLDNCTRSPLVKEIVFESRLGAEALPYLVDHQVHGRMALPAAGYLEMILAAAKSAFSAETHVVEDLIIHEPLILPEKGECVVQLVFTPSEREAAAFKLISLGIGQTQESSWKQHATGKIALVKTNGAPAEKKLAIETAQRRCPEEIVVNDYYSELRARGLQLGYRFQGLAKLWRRDGESLGQIQLPQEMHAEIGDYHFHPALLDACLQIFVAAWPGKGHRVAHGGRQVASGKEVPSHAETPLPLNFESYRFYKRPTTQLWSNIVLHKDEKKNDKTYSGDVFIYDRDGDLSAEIKGLQVKRSSLEVRQNPNESAVTEDHDLIALPCDTHAPVQLKITTPGVLEGLKYEPAVRRQPEADEVEIRVHAAGMNFKDVLNALGKYPGEVGPLGGECAGTIVAVGKNVEGFQVGDKVMALAPGSFSTYVTTLADWVVRKPAPLSFEEAATIPRSFTTAYHTLMQLAKLSAGKKVLIHAAASGAGLAAVQIAQRAGAKIFATAGNEEKREYLRSLGLRYVMDSRSLGFAHEIMQFTDEEGVDVVLNSLSGEFIPISLSVLKDDGRFIEIGNRDIWTRKQVDEFKRVGEYHVVDLALAAQDNPRLIKSLLHEVMAGINDGSLKPLPMRVFPCTEVVDAFRCLQQAKHIGKIVVRQEAGSEAQ